MPLSERHLSIGIENSLQLVPWCSAVFVSYMLGGGLEEDWGGLEKDWRRIGEGSEKDWRRIGDGPPMPSCFVIREKIY